jgi:hypothetical protein
MKNYISILAVAISITACQSHNAAPDIQGRLVDEIGLPIIPDEVINLESAKVSGTPPSYRDILFQVCMDYNQSQQKPYWVCKAYFVQNLKGYPVIEDPIIEWKNRFMLTSRAITPYIKERNLQTGEAIFDNVYHSFQVEESEEGDTLSFESSQLLSFDKKGGDNYVETPNIIECSGTVDFSLTGGSGFFGDFCYYKLNSHSN